VELVDALVLGTSSSECRFESCQGHHKYNGLVAQLGEQLPCTEKAAGSSPV
jgi:hypothetical protein